MPDLDAALGGEVLLRPDLSPGSNIYCNYRIRKGDVATGWAAAEVVVEGTYQVPYQEHAYLQPEAGAQLRSTRTAGSRWRSPASGPTRTRSRSRTPSTSRPTRAGRLPGDRRRLRRTRGHVAPDRARPRVVAACERGERRPIRSRWIREESIVGHHKRHRGHIAGPVGRDPRRAGRGRRSRGATSTPVPTTTRRTRSSGTSTSRCPARTSIPHLDVDSYAVYTTPSRRRLPRLRRAAGRRSSPRRR